MQDVNKYFDQFASSRRIVVVLVSLTLLFTINSIAQGTCTGAAPVAFTNAPDVAVGVRPFSVAIGDVNNDGKPDIAVSNVDADSVSIRLGDGTGGFSGSATVAVGDWPTGVAIADFNNDGKPDIAVSNADSWTVSILIGDGLGGFVRTNDVGVGWYPYSLVTGDFNRDGNKDFATANYYANSVSVRLGNGTGGFTGGTELYPGDYTYSVAIGDFNNDNIQDLAATKYNLGKVAIWLGNGSGGFIAMPDADAGYHPFSVAVGDFNNDGKADFGAANLWPSPVHPPTISIRLGNGAGAFIGTTSVTVGGLAYWFAIGDFNNDGNQDLASANILAHTVSIRLGDGSGGFTGTLDVASGAGTNPWSVAVGDLNSDGKLDFVTTNAATNNIGVRLGVNTAPCITSYSTTQQQVTSANRQIAAVADVDRIPGTLTVTASPLTGSGVSLSNILVDSTGAVYADVAASCGAVDSTFTLTVTDIGGMTATAMWNVTVTPETTPPVIDPITNVVVYLPLNSTATSMPVNFALPTATDNCSTLVTTEPLSGSVFNAGTTTVNVLATDVAGNTSNSSFTVTVLFNFSGFFQPVDNLPTVNVVKAGQSILVKFSLNGYKGLNIFAPGYPMSALVPCSSAEAGDAVEETVNAGGSSLTYNSTTGQYSYVWKTNKAWKGDCRMLRVKLIDGTEHYAKFQFR